MVDEHEEHCDCTQSLNVKAVAGGGRPFVRGLGDCSTLDLSDGRRCPSGLLAHGLGTFRRLPGP